MNDKVLKISLDDWKVIYFKGKKFAEGHDIPGSKLIRLGMLLQEAGKDISDLLEVYIEDSDVSNESLLWDWPNNYDDVDPEVKAAIENLYEVWSIE